MARLWATMKQDADNQDVSYPEHNPLTKLGKKVMCSMRKQYGKGADDVFYATMNKKKMGKKWHR